ncbi:MAG: hypothetical protein HRU12_09640 [Phaeodactylibacter sp.]|nr:hypothetical protein [Phaeodactylibacter sp.]
MPKDLGLPRGWATKVADETGYSKQIVYRVVRNEDYKYPSIWTAIKKVISEADKAKEKAKAALNVAAK